MTQSLQVFRAQAKSFRDMHEGEQATVKDVHEARDLSSMVGADKPCGAIMFNRDGGDKFRAASGQKIPAGISVINSAKDAGWTRVTLAISVADNMIANPVDDEVLAALAQFDDVTVLLVGDDRSVVIATLSK
jgi:hypothetical protein